MLRMKDTHVFQVKRELTFFLKIKRFSLCTKLYMCLIDTCIIPA